MLAVSASDGTSVTCAVGANPAGTYAISVVTAVSMATGSVDFTYDMEITSISPNTGKKNLHHPYTHAHPCTCTYDKKIISTSLRRHFDVTSTGSFGGGQSIVVSGRGFSTDDGAISITVCGEACDVTDATTSAITCTTPSNTGE